MSADDSGTDSNTRLDLEYDGTDFNGWAKQPGQPTIEAALEETLGRILQQPLSLTVAGRTDTGVHAHGQVVNFRSMAPVDPRRLQWSANQMLPEAISIKGVRHVPEDFDARRSALSRSYSYTVLRRHWPSAFRHRFVHFINGQLDLDAMVEAAALIAGRHDFTAFTPTLTEHSYFERDIIFSEWVRDDDLLIYNIRSSGFLRAMVRTLVGTMLEIGRGQRPVSELEELLKGGRRADAGETAPASGLCLERVEYQEEGNRRQT